MTLFSHMTLLHGKDELPNGTVERLEAALRQAQPEITYARPFIPPFETDEATQFVLRNYISRLPRGSLLVGLERGGLIACAVQQAFPALNLSVVAINSPTDEKGIVAEPWNEYYGRLLLYSTAYPAIKYHCMWKSQGNMAYDVDWLKAGADKVVYSLGYLISTYCRGSDMDKELATLFPPVGV